MKQGTPEQSQQIRRQLLIVSILFGVGLIVLLTVQTSLIDPLIDPRAGLGFALLVKLLTWGVGFGGLVFVLRPYWRCPACHHRFSRRSKARYCSHCDTRFAPLEGEQTPMKRWLGRLIIVVAVGWMLMLFLGLVTRPVKHRPGGRGGDSSVVPGER